MKALLLALLAANSITFHSTVFKAVDEWGTAPRSPPRARLAAFISLLLWSRVVASGRAIAYLHRP